MVAPYMGAWIEMPGVKSLRSLNGVAPYMGAWIEIILPFASKKAILVAPYIGAWIAIDWNAGMGGEHSRRTLHGCVD